MGGDLYPPSQVSQGVPVQFCADTEELAGLTRVAVLDDVEDLDGEDVVDAAGSFRDMATVTLAAAREGLDPAYHSKNPWYLTWLHVGPVAPENQRAAIFQIKTNTQPDAAEPIRRKDQRHAERSRAGQKRDWVSMNHREVMEYSSRSKMTASDTSSPMTPDGNYSTYQPRPSRHEMYETAAAVHANTMQSQELCRKRLTQLLELRSENLSAMEVDYRNKNHFISELDRDPYIEESNALQTSLEKFNEAHQKVQEARSQLEAHLCEGIASFTSVLDTVMSEIG